LHSFARNLHLLDSIPNSSTGLPPGGTGEPLQSTVPSRAAQSPSESGLQKHHGRI